MENGKWIVRGACLVLLLGFFLPSVAVSCSGQTLASVSLASLAGGTLGTGQTILYIFPVMVLVAAGLTFLGGMVAMNKNISLWGQLGAVGLGGVIVLISLANLYSSGGGYGYAITVTPDYGFFILVLGGIAFGVGWAMQFMDQRKSQAGYGYSAGGYSPPPVQPGGPYGTPQGGGYAPPAVHGYGMTAYLDLVAGNLPTRRISVTSANFSMGRSADNSLRLPDPAVSRVHALLRQAQGVWFLQDQNSTGGTYVNGMRTPATRVNEGDEIGIGPFRFRFHAG